MFAANLNLDQTINEQDTKRTSNHNNSMNHNNAVYEPYSNDETPCES